jgi:flagellar basal-body rod modification protein FlgD
MIDGVTSQGTGNLFASGQVQPGGSLGKDEFLQLLVSQLRDQDPLNPAEPQEFAAQLAQFSSVEQLLNIGQQLALMADGNAALIATINSSSAIDLIGKNVMVMGNTVEMPDTGELSVKISVGGNGGSGELVLRDEFGVEVLRMPVQKLDPGLREIDLTGLVGQVPAGHYKYSVELTDSAGVAAPVTTFAVVRVEGVRYTTHGPVLTVGPDTIPLGDVLEIIG